MTKPDPKPVRPKVVVVYHFFAHYRAAVMRELLDSDRFEFLMAGDRVGRPSEQVKPWDDYPPERFLFLPCRWLKGPIMWQRGLIRMALRRDLRAIVYLGNAYWPSTWLSALLARLSGKHVLFWTHGWRKPDRQFRKRRFRCTFYKIAHDLLFYGHTGKMHGIDAGLDPDAIHVIYNSLDYDWQCQTRAKVTDHDIRRQRADLFPDSANPLVFFSGRLIPSCRLDMLLDAMAILAGEGHPVDALLVGGGPEQAALQQQADTLGLNVCFYGPCYDENILARLMMASNVTVSPGKIGLTAIHSLTYGTPVITHDNSDYHGPEYEAIMSGITGELFAHEDVRSLADAILNWTSTEYPRADIRARCHHIVDRFWNPKFQRLAIERALDRRPADDLFWMKEPLPDDYPLNPGALMP
jgi:1,2-diacylglycerol 3-alpha-glucosyltransferase